MNQGRGIRTNMLMVMEQCFFYFKRGVRENLTKDLKEKDIKLCQHMNQE